MLDLRKREREAIEMASDPNTEVIDFDRDVLRRSDDD